MRLERNTAGSEDVRSVFLYNHGFPDSAVVPNALRACGQPATRVGSDEAGERLYSSALPRRWGDGLLQTTAAAAFVCFNTRGIPGSGGDFFDKT